MQDEWNVPESPRGVAQFPSPIHGLRKKAPSSSGAATTSKNSGHRRHGNGTKRQSRPRKRVVFLEEGHPGESDDYGSSCSSSESAGDVPPPLPPPAQFPKVKCYYYAPERPELSAEELHAMYYSKKNFKAFKKDAQKLAQLTDAEEAQALYVRAFLDVYQKSGAATDASSSSNGNSHQKSVEEARVAVSDRACLPLATAPVRGLERHIFPGLIHDQKQVKKSILRAQEKIPASITPDVRARILASASILLSRQARHVARTMAHADSIIALSIYRQTFLPQKMENTKKNSGDSSSCSKSNEIRSRKDNSGEKRTKVASGQEIPL